MLHITIHPKDTRHMKKILLGIVTLTCWLHFEVHAQAPQKFSYQAVAADAAGNELANTVIGLRFSIVKDSLDGEVVWMETHQTGTDPFGLFTVQVGTGTPAGGTAATFAEIDWSSGTYFLRVEMDPAGGSNYSLMGTTQLLSVPYALYAETAGSAKNDLDTDPTNELQTLEVSGDTLKLSGAPPVVFADADADPTNELQTLGLNGTILSLSGTNSEVDLSTVSGDNDPTNELQQLLINGDTLMLSNGGGSVVLSEGNIFSAPGASLSLPQGIDNEFVFIPDTLTVPSGKTFYVIAAEDDLFLPDFAVNGFGLALTSPSMPMFGQGVFVDNCRCIGFFKDFDPLIEPLVIVLQANNGNTFNVPPDKNLIIKSGLDATTPITLNGAVINFFSSNFEALVIPPNTAITNNSADEVILTGYLLAFN